MTAVERRAPDPGAGLDEPAERITAAAERIRASGWGPARPAAEPVNRPMIRHWLEALQSGDHGFLADDVAPASMAQVWTMRGLAAAPDPQDPLQAMSRVLDEAGYPSVVATDCDQTYHRPIRVGERVSARSRLTELAGPKRTALGDGWFVTTRTIWQVGDEPVAQMLFRVLKFRPGTGRADRPGTGESGATRSGATSSGATTSGAMGSGPGRGAEAGPPGVVLRPVVSRDTAFFWAGTSRGELRIQRCAGCGRLRHPPGPGCPECGRLQPDPAGYVVVSGAGRLYSFVVHHHPPIPGRRLPVVVGLVELPEGVRMVGELVDVDPAAVRIGMDLEPALQRVDDELVLPAWRPVPSPAPGPGAVLPVRRIPVTPTFVISTALATRDFQDVHHDPAAALERGSPDIFLNILTTTGLVQTFVSGWAPAGTAVGRVAVRLGVPCHPGDVLTLTGHVSSYADPGPGGRPCTVEVAGTVPRGRHVTATVELLLPDDPTIDDPGGTR